MAAYHSSATDHQVAADDQNQTTVIAFDELKRAAEKVKFNLSKIEAKMHRYPAIFRGLMSIDDRYFVPRCVAIGPYHHHAAHVQRAEEIKRAAAFFFCNDSGHSAEVVYAKIRSVADNARRCYDHDAVAGLSVPQSSSAIDLAEISIQLTQNRTAKLRDMGVGKGPFCFCNNLFLAPLVMDDLNACWLLNMVALEISLANDDSTVRSYVLLIAMLMNREEDVHELRVKRILHGKFSDQRTLSFFKDLAELIFLTREYTLILAQVEDYRRKYRMWISLHKFIYNNFKYIVTVFSVIGVLVGIFKALFSIKQA
ncbi:unnamed protein product [Urochloa decumbens]|uniref:Uncharacterized protein n=1 Tax=Urochloa decumbens TaxID=240449 RepID=A0ABC9C7Q3_9POAL